MGCYSREHKAAPQGSGHSLELRELLGSALIGFEFWVWEPGVGLLIPVGPFRVFVILCLFAAGMPLLFPISGASTFA